MAQAPHKTIHLKNYQPTPYLIETVNLTFHLDETATRVVSRMRVRPNPKAKKLNAPLVLNGENIELQSVTVNGKQANHKRTAQNLTLKDLPTRAFDLEIETICNPKENTALSGLYLSNGTYCTQCEAEGFRRITYFYDRPDVLTIYTVRIEASDALPVLLSNGNPIESGKTAQGQHFATWHDPHPKPSYLFALVAGDLASVHDTFTTMEGREVNLGIYVEKGKQDRCAWAMLSLKTSMRWDETAYKRIYDLEVFNIVAVSDFNMGAMENKGLNIFNDKYILAKPETATDTDYELIEAIIAHEYFHNWTGNRITCRDWFQLCLKEGLTVFRDQEFTADLRSRSVKRIDDVQDLRSRQFPEDLGPLRHPPRPSTYIEINNFYTSTVYEKGAEICRMLQTLLSKKTFAKAMQLYFKRHDGQAATVEDFVACFADTSKQNLKQFMRWYTQSGTPTISVSDKYDAKSKTYSLTLIQGIKELREGKQPSPLHIPLQYGLLNSEGKDVQAGFLQLKSHTKTFTFKNLTERPTLSLNRDFSAPVIIVRDVSDADLTLQMRNDSDLFNRWEAAQELATRLIVTHYNGEEVSNKEFSLALKSSLKDETLEPAYRAKLLDFPDFNTLTARLKSNISPEKLSNARKSFITDVASYLGPDIKVHFDSLQQEENYVPDAQSIGLRSYRSALLGLAIETKAKWCEQTLHQDFTTAQNMTQELTSLKLAQKLNRKLGEEFLNSFYNKHQSDHLIIDKWFAVQSSDERPGAAARIKKLTSHPAFTYKTPNRVYALLRNFIGNNFTGFHAENGEGYKLAADAILKLDTINPQVASRLATGFRSWRMFDDNNTGHAFEQLQRILSQKSLSPDVFEIITKTLKI